MTQRVARRRFLTAAAGAIGGVHVLRHGRSARAYWANERLRLAVFGNMYNAAHFLTAAHIYNADLVAVCNPDQRKKVEIVRQWQDRAEQLQDAAQRDQQSAAEQYRRLARGEGVRWLADIRQLFDERSDEIDALVVSDYDHFHGVACGAALRAGKPICSERPLGLTISDARQLRFLAAQTGLPTTYRSPGTGAGPFRRAMELVQEGAIGRIDEAHVWFRRGGPDRATTPTTSQPVPEGLDWDLWLGPLAWREYHPDWMAYAHWRETCNGGLGSFGPHTMVFPFLVLALRQLWDTAASVVRVRAECSRTNRVSFPRWERVRWEIPARDPFAPLAITWHHGPEFAPGTRERIHAILRRFGVADPDAADALMGMAGSILVGSDGALVANDHSVRVTALPTDRFESLATAQPRRIAASHGIYRDWIDACRGIGGGQILASFDNGGPLSELLMLGNIATLFPGETLAYEPAIGQITNHAEGNQRIGFQYREGWRI